MPKSILMTQPEQRRDLATELAERYLAEDNAGGHSIISLASLVFIDLPDESVEDREQRVIDASRKLVERFASYNSRTSPDMPLPTRRGSCVRGVPQHITALDRPDRRGRTDLQTSSFYVARYRGPVEIVGFNVQALGMTISPRTIAREEVRMPSGGTLHPRYPAHARETVYRLRIADQLIRQITAISQMIQVVETRLR